MLNLQTLKKRDAIYLMVARFYYQGFVPEQTTASQPEYFINKSRFLPIT